MISKEMGKLNCTMLAMFKVRRPGHDQSGSRAPCLLSTPPTQPSSLQTNSASYDKIRESATHTVYGNVLLCKGVAAFTYTCQGGREGAIQQGTDINGTCKQINRQRKLPAWQSARSGPLANFDCYRLRLWSRQAVGRGRGGELGVLVYRTLCTLHVSKQLPRCRPFTSKDTDLHAEVALSSPRSFSLLVFLSSASSNTSFFRFDNSS